MVFLSQHCLVDALVGLLDHRGDFLGHAWDVGPNLSEEFAEDQDAFVGDLEGADSGDLTVAGNRWVIARNQLTIAFVGGPGFWHLIQAYLHGLTEGFGHLARHHRNEVVVLGFVVAHVDGVGTRARLNHDSVIQVQRVTWVTLGHLACWLLCWLRLELI